MAKLIPPADGVTIRMYRIGHGDCFLIAAPRADGGDPVYVLIDCGYKPGSQAAEFLHGKSASDIVAHLIEACGGHLDLAIATHEHQDHLNAVWRKRDPYFGPLSIDETWLAWTEKPDDPLAVRLRQANHDQLLGLIAARNRLALALGEGSPDVRQIDLLLGLETGEEGENFATPEARFGAADASQSFNKQGLKLLKDKAGAARGVRYCYPGEGPLLLPGSAIRVYVLGPPYSEELIEDEDPKGAEGFPDDRPHGFSLGAAARSDNGGESPFAHRFGVPLDSARSGGDPFFTAHYGHDDEGESRRDGAEVADDAPFRRIDTDWLLPATDQALAMAQGTNNTSLVLAFELPATKKVLLFVGDAQRGNWVSWADLTWTVEGAEVTTRNLFGRTVLYKVGHHGSHNATLAGRESDPWPNLAWMATGSAASEFTTMITAVNKWAVEKAEWIHPLPAIKTALEQKAAGRVFQTDTDALAKPEGVTAGAWQVFTDRAVFDELYFDYTVFDR
jgi:hypothetical protein